MVERFGAPVNCAFCGENPAGIPGPGVAVLRIQRLRIDLMNRRRRLKDHGTYCKDDTSRHLAPWKSNCLDSMSALGLVRPAANPTNRRKVVHEQTHIRPADAV